MSWDDIIRADLAGLEPYRPGLRASEVRERTGHERVVKLSSNESPDGPFPSAIAAIEAVAPRLNRYPDGSARALREKLATRLGITAEEVVVGAGSNELLRLIAQAVLTPGDEVVYAWPSFVVYPMVCGMFGVKGVAVPLKDGVHDVEAMLAAITPKTKLIFLCNPNNPTGTVYGRKAFEKVLAEVPPHVLVVVDEAYFEFVTRADFPDGMEAFDGRRPLVVARTFSKIYGLAGARVGYAAAPRPLAEAVDKVREPFNVSSLAQAAAYYSIDDDAEVRRRRASNQEQKTYLYSGFDRLGVSYLPSETNFVWVSAAKPVEAFEALLEEGVIVRSFGPAGALRVTVPSAQDAPAVIAAFEAAVARLGSL
ncbi:MAG TPA: histidinol-phosphate transaminase [Coriobacteriia bacterium]